MTEGLWGVVGSNESNGIRGRFLIRTVDVNQLSPWAAADEILDGLFVAFGRRRLVECDVHIGISF